MMMLTALVLLMQTAQAAREPMTTRDWSVTVGKGPELRISLMTVGEVETANFEIVRGTFFSIVSRRVGPRRVLVLTSPASRDFVAYSDNGNDPSSLLCFRTPIQQFCFFRSDSGTPTVRLGLDTLRDSLPQEFKDGVRVLTDTATTEPHMEELRPILGGLQGTAMPFFESDKRRGLWTSTDEWRRRFAGQGGGIDVDRRAFTINEEFGQTVNLLLREESGKVDR